MASTRGNPIAEVVAGGTTTVFQPGKLPVVHPEISVDHRTAPTPPIPMMIVAPSKEAAGRYPVLVFVHGFSLHTYFYRQLLKLVASFGFIVVAPQFQFSLIPPLPISDADDILTVGKVIDWLPEGLPAVLPAGVEADLSKLALAGHSRGGHTAFALALGHAKTSLPISGLIGLDPVGGHSRSAQLPPAILTYEPCSFNIAMPVMVIGTGLGSEWRLLPPIPPFAPEGVSHDEFFNECRPPCYHLVTKDYGHVDMLDDEYNNWIAKAGSGSKDAMRRTVAGIMVAFTRAVLGGEDGDLQAILKCPDLAPATLDPVEKRLPAVITSAHQAEKNN